MDVAKRLLNAHVIACCSILGAIRLVLIVWPPIYIKKVKKKNNKTLKKDIFFVWNGPKEILLEFLSCLYSKNDRVKLMYYVIDESSISFLDLFLYNDANFSSLQFSIYQKPLK